MKYEVSPEYYNYEDFPELVSFGDFGIARGLGTQDIRLFPVKFDVNTNMIKLYLRSFFKLIMEMVSFPEEKQKMNY